MYKNYFHNNKQTIENNDRIKNSLESKTQAIQTKGFVDINILLNRVKLEKKNEKKRKAIFIGSTFIIVFLGSVLLSIIS